MKKVTIKSISLLNFKGQRDLQVNFDPVATSILGANGTGKSTIFDAFTWVMFGKDSHDRSDFNIKTLDATGQAIPKLPHEVTIALEVDGEAITLTRRYNEVWRKKRGCATEEFGGHEQERLYNDVPCSVSEWKQKISDIISEEDFKYISNPSYFTSQRADKQRKKLCEMAGTISDADIAAGNDDFLALIQRLQGKTIDELKREIGAKKRRCKGEIDAIPERIDERKRDMPVETDWLQVEAELAEKEGALEEVEKILNDSFAHDADREKRKRELQKEVNDLLCYIEGIEYQTRQRANKGLYEAQRAEEKRQRNITDLQEQIKWDTKMLEEAQTNLSAYNHQREGLIAEWREINARHITIDPADLNCPTCGQPYAPEDAAKIQAQMIERFNAEKAALIADNVRKGKSVKGSIETTLEAIRLRQKKVDDANAELATLQAAAPVNIPAEPTEAELEALYNDDPEWQSAKAKIDALNADLRKIGEEQEADLSEYHDAKAVLKSNIDELKKILARKDIIERNNKRIAELEADLRNNAEELAELEGLEYTIAAFSKAKIEAVESRINGMFRIVKFKMFEQQINGGETETCEATVNGVPFSSLNTAMQVNAGLDIINAISKHHGISVPIFIENAEGVLQLEPTEAQTIRLVVADVPKLIVSAKKSANLFD